MPHLLMTAAIIALSAAGVVEAQAANYYVALSGADGNPGTQAAPFRTINHALSVAGADDTVYVRGGTYGAVRFTHGGATGQPLTLRNFPGEQPVIEPQPCGTAGTQSILLKNGGGLVLPIGWIVIQGLELRCGHDNIKYHNAHDLLIRGNYLHHSRFQGILGEGSSRVVIDLNVITDNGWEPGWENRAHGVYITGSDVVVENNLIVGNTANGIQVAARIFNSSKYAGPEYATAENWVIQYNTFALQKYRGGITVYGAGGLPTNIAIDSNIFYRNSVVSGTLTGINFYKGSGGQLHPVRGNIFYGGDAFRVTDGTNAYFETGSLYLDPQLTDPNNGGFRPLVGSPAIDAAFLYGSTPTATDLALTSRPQGLRNDIGAFEFSPK